MDVRVRTRDSDGLVSLPSALPRFSFEEGPLIGRGAFGLVNLAIVTAVGEDDAPAPSPPSPKWEELTVRRASACNVGRDAALPPPQPHPPRAPP